MTQPFIHSTNTGLWLHPKLKYYTRDWGDRKMNGTWLLAAVEDSLKHKGNLKYDGQTLYEWERTNKKDVVSVISLALQACYERHF